MDAYFFHLFIFQFPSNLPSSKTVLLFESCSGTLFVDIRHLAWVIQDITEVKLIVSSKVLVESK